MLNKLLLSLVDCFERKIKVSQLSQDEKYETLYLVWGYGGPLLLVLCDWIQMS